jgi:hypothetical protein
MKQTGQERKEQLQDVKPQSLVDIRYGSRKGGYNRRETGLVLDVYKYRADLDVWKFWIHPIFPESGRLLMCRVGKYTQPVVVRTTERYTVEQALEKVAENYKESPTGVFNWERLSARDDPDITVEVTDIRNERP